MIEWAVIADDLTGAADTGVQFRPVCAPVFLADYRKLDAPALRAAAMRRASARVRSDMRRASSTGSR